MILLLISAVWATIGFPGQLQKMNQELITFDNIWINEGEEKVTELNLEITEGQSNDINGLVTFEDIKSLEIVELKLMDLPVFRIMKKDGTVLLGEAKESHPVRSWSIDVKGTVEYLEIKDIKSIVFD
jgi:hypothetical protein